MIIFFYRIESYFMDLLGEKGSYLLDDNLSKQPLWELSAGWDDKCSVAVRAGR